MKMHCLDGTSLIATTEDIRQFYNVESMYFDVTAQLVQKVKADVKSHLL